MPSPLMLSSTPTRLGTFNIDSVDYEVVVIAAHSPPLPTTTSTIPQLSRPLRNILFNTNVASISALCSIPCFKLVLVSSKHSNPAADIDCSFKFDRRVDTSTSNFKSLLQISALPFKVDSLRRQIRFKSQLVLAFNFRCCASKLILCRKISTVAFNSRVSQLKNANSTHFVDSVTPYHCLRSTSSRRMFGLLSLRTGTRSYLGDFNLIHFQVSLMNYLQICLRTHSDVERGKGIVEGHTTQVEAITHVETMLQSVVIITAFGTVKPRHVSPSKYDQVTCMAICTLFLRVHYPRVLVVWPISLNTSSRRLALSKSSAALSLQFARKPRRMIASNLPSSIEVAGLLRVRLRLEPGSRRARARMNGVHGERFEHTYLFPNAAVLVLAPPSPEMPQFHSAERRTHPAQRVKRPVSTLRKSPAVRTQRNGIRNAAQLSNCDTYRNAVRKRAIPGEKAATASEQGS
ncbi:hypothetical protein C8R43DRAFT_1232656 [Mycena crocata]|nr:hypothetical protein C8R43DRAFT_1232655 [Mycena crocata]KAJ7165611.1 hypothetical protein C8R43DRAFT_1232656 [Mycena crocata]